MEMLFHLEGNVNAGHGYAVRSFFTGQKWCWFINQLKPWSPLKPASPGTAGPLRLGTLSEHADTEGRGGLRI